MYELGGAVLSVTDAASSSGSMSARTFRIRLWSILDTVI